MIDEGPGDLRADTFGVADSRLLNRRKHEISQRVVSLFRLLALSPLVSLNLGKQFAERLLCRALTILVAFLYSFGPIRHGNQERVARFLFRCLLDALNEIDNFRIVAAVLLLDQFDGLLVDRDEIGDRGDGARHDVLLHEIVRLSLKRFVDVDGFGVRLATIA